LKRETRRAYPSQQEENLSKEHLKSTGDQVAGAVKDSVDGPSPDSKLQTEVTIDKATRAVQHAVGAGRDTANHAVTDLHPPPILLTFCEI
jgi:uncharacterized protein YjbJ (UPF0337 family)